MPSLTFQHFKIKIMRNYFYPSPGSNFHIHTWESWNKLSTTISKKSSTPKHTPQRQLKVNSSLGLSPSFSNPKNLSPSITLNRRVNYVKYNRKKSENTQEEIFPLIEEIQEKSLRLSSRVNFPSNGKDLAILLQGTKISTQRTAKTRPLSSKNFPRARTQQRSYTIYTVKREEELETPTPW